MRLLYEQLYEDCSASESFFRDAHFVSMQGEHYLKNSKRFMLIGRAPNGWGSLDTQSRETFGKDAESQLRSYDRWNWIESVNGTLYSTHDRHETNLSKRYCIDKKPFWTYAKSIWKQLPGSFTEDDVWQKNIVWSNLYKVSPFEKDNPDWQTRQLQYQACLQILKRELELFQPTHILIATGFDWFEPFSSLFEQVVDTGKRNVARGRGKNEVYVEGTAAYRGAKTVIACRPEWRDRSGYVAEVVKTFREGF